MLLLVFVIDIFVFALCCFLLRKQGSWTFLHPATICFGFHFFVVTFRVFSILIGAPTLFNESLYLSAGFSPITEEEIVRASLFADLALFASTLAYLIAQKDHNYQKKKSVETTSREILLQNNRVYPVLLITGIVGVIGLIIVSELPGRSSRILNTLAVGEWASSSWIFITQFWLASLLILLIYLRGFQRFLLILFAGYLVFQLLQGFHRFRFVLPILMLMNIYVLRGRLRWPPRWMFIVGLIGMLLFLPAKYIGTMLSAGEPLDKIVNNTIEYLVALPTRSASDLVLLDQFAASLTLVDKHEQFYWGTTYLPILTLPIPRQLWPQKPEIAFYLSEIQTPQRPMAKLGAIVTLVGESYINFSIAGIVIVPALFAYIMARVYFRVQQLSYYAVTSLAYVMFSAAGIQVYRDGLPSVVLFTAVSFMPIAIIILLHWMFPPKFIASFNTVPPSIRTSSLELKPKTRLRDRKRNIYPIAETED